jgi:hypothetical protein
MEIKSLLSLDQLWKKMEKAKSILAMLVLKKVQIAFLKKGQ